jgi:type II restriction enzyme
MVQCVFPEEMELLDDGYEESNNPDSYITSKAAIGERWRKLIYEKDNFYKLYLIDAERFIELLTDHLDGIRDLEDEELYWRLCRAMGISNNAEFNLTRDAVNKRIDFKSLFKDQESREFIVKEMRDRYLIGCGENLTGRMKNISGLLGEQELLDCLFDCLLNSADEIYVNINKKWEKYVDQELLKIRGVSWSINGKERVLLFRFIIPDVSVNVDMVLLDAGRDNVDLVYNNKKKVETTDIFDGNVIINTIKHRDIKHYLACGELKSGVAPSGATQLWKSAISATLKVKRKSIVDIKTFVIAATISESIAKDMEHHLEDGNVDRIANLTKANQLKCLCEWLINF